MAEIRVETIGTIEWLRRLVEYKFYWFPRGWAVRVSPEEFVITVYKPFRKNLMLIAHEITHFFDMSHTNDFTLTAWHGIRLTVTADQEKCVEIARKLLEADVVNA